MPSKACKKCEVVKPLDSFALAPQCKDGHRGECKECRAHREKGIWERTGHRPSRTYEYKRNKYLIWKFGITKDDYDALALAQGGRCAICGDQSAWNRREGELLPVDHDHITGKVRALLCHACNQALGLMRDNPELLRAAADYIDKHRVETVQDQDANVQDVLDVVKEIRVKQEEMREENNG
jgi:Recombination endonuclease VII